MLGFARKGATRMRIRPRRIHNIGLPRRRSSAATRATVAGAGGADDASRGWTLGPTPEFLMQIKALRRLCCPGLALRSRRSKAAPVRRADKPDPPPPVDYPAKWNSLVPERPVDVSLFTERPAAYSDPVFQGRFPEICEKFQSLIQRGASLTYADLFRRDKETGMYWWKRGLMGGLEWMVRNGSGNGRPDPTDALLAKYSKGKEASA